VVLGCDSGASGPRDAEGASDASTTPDAPSDGHASDGAPPDVDDAGARLTSAIEGYWPFDGDGRDLSGHGRPLQLVGGPSFEAGVSGSSLSLSGSVEQFAARPIGDSAFDLITENFTISLWARFADSVPEQALVEKISGRRGPGWSFTKLGTQEAHFSAPVGISVFASLARLTTFVWHHFVTRRSGSFISIVVDGVLVATEPTTERVAPSPSPLVVGVHQEGTARQLPFVGRIDEVAIWSRALDDQEVLYLWNGGTGNRVAR
jgi:hypothetical protein